MTPDDLREQVRAALAGRVAVTGPCPRCGGRGVVQVSRPAITQAEVAAAIGTSRTSVTNFLSGRQTFTMETTLRLLDWLDAVARDAEVAIQEAAQ